MPCHPVTATCTPRAHAATVSFSTNGCLIAKGQGGNRGFFSGSLSHAGARASDTLSLRRPIERLLRLPAAEMRTSAFTRQLQSRASVFLGGDLPDFWPCMSYFPAFSGLHLNRSIGETWRPPAESQISLEPSHPLKVGMREVDADPFSNLSAQSQAGVLPQPWHQ